MAPGAHPEDNADAIAALQRSVELDPEFVWGHYNLALAYGAVGDVASAAASVRTLLEIDPSFEETIREDVQFRRLRQSTEFENLLGNG
jgi:tetratricopeptide (TPR) repeat protein